MSPPAVSSQAVCLTCCRRSTVCVCAFGRSEEADGGVLFPRLEFERQQREELEKLEMKRYVSAHLKTSSLIGGARAARVTFALFCSRRRLIKEMEAKQQSEKAELERLQQEVESQRKESEEVQQRILRQEESLHRRSQDIESRLRDFLAEKERFEEERRSEINEVDLQRRRRRKEPQEHEADRAEEQDEQQRRHQEAAEQTEIYRELERLKREREEQRVRLETERRRLEEQEREQLSLVGRLEEQLREKHEAATALLTREDAHRLEEEQQALTEIREALLCAKEAAERPDVEDAGEEARAAQSRYADFKAAQVKELDLLEEGLRQQRERLEKEVAAERGALLLLTHGLRERQQHLKETQEKGAQDATAVCHEEQLLRQAEHRLQLKERQLANLANGLLPALAEEKQRASELLERSGNGNCDRSPGLDNTLFQVEKELEDKEEKLSLHWHSARQLQQLQETYEFTANVARQEEKVRRKEKEILESKEKQQREAMEQAVARLERRHSALRRSVSLEPDSEEQRSKSSVARTPRTGAELDQQRFLWKRFPKGTGLIRQLHILFILAGAFILKAHCVFRVQSAARDPEAAAANQRGRRHQPDALHQQRRTGGSRRLARHSHPGSEHAAAAVRRQVRHTKPRLTLQGPPPRVHCVCVCVCALQDKRLHRRGSPAAATQDEPPERQQHGSVSVHRITASKRHHTLHHSPHLTCRAPGNGGRHVL